MTKDCSARKKRIRARAIEEGVGRCHWCARPVRSVDIVSGKAPFDAATIDHVYPRGDRRRLELAAQTLIVTKVIACFACNQERGDTPYDEFLKRKRPEWANMEPDR